MGFKLGKYMSPIVISTTMSASMSQNVFSYRVQPSLYALWKSVSPENPGQKPSPASWSNFYYYSVFFFFLKKKEKEEELFKRISKTVRTNGALVRLKLIQRRVIIPDEFLTFHDPLVQDPRNLLGNCVKFRAIYRRSYEFRFFLFRPVDTTYTLINAQFRRLNANPNDAT